MVTTKKKCLTLVLAVAMALVLFGVLGMTQVNAAAPDGYKVTVREDVNSAESVTKTYTKAEIEAMADVSDATYMFCKDSTSANVFHVTKGVKIETLIKDVLGETADVEQLAGVKCWDETGYYAKLNNIKDHLINPVYLYEQTKYDSTEEKMTVAGGTEVKPVLALDYETVMLGKTVNKQGQEIVGILDRTVTELTSADYQKEGNVNRMFLGMLSENEAGGFWSQQNSYGIDIIKSQAKQTVTVTAKGKTLSAKKLKKKAQTVKTGAEAVSAEIAEPASVTFSKGSVNKSAKNFTVDKKTGNIKVKKGTKKGTYNVTLKATVAGDGQYYADTVGSTVVTIKVKK